MRQLFGIAIRNYRIVSGTDKARQNSNNCVIIQFISRNENCMKVGAVNLTKFASRVDRFKGKLNIVDFVKYIP